MSAPYLTRPFLFLALLIALGSTAQAAKISVQFISEPPGATVQINGKIIGTTPCQIEVEDFMVKVHGLWIFSKYLTVISQ